jgi:hypothetical protein
LGQALDDDLKVTWGTIFQNRQAKKKSRLASKHTLKALTLVI